VDVSDVRLRALEREIERTTGERVVVLRADQAEEVVATLAAEVERIERNPVMRMKPLEKHHAIVESRERADKMRSAIRVLRGEK
jgi:hypothetical protein